MSSYFVAFSNDSRDWTTLHDGYAEWVSGKLNAHHAWQKDTELLDDDDENLLLQLFYGNVDKDTPVMTQFSTPVVARYIRILPQSWNGSLCLRAEVLACQLPSQ